MGAFRTAILSQTYEDFNIIRLSSILGRKSKHFIVSDSKQGVSSFQHKSVKLLPNKILGGVYGCRKLFTLERENTKLS